MNTKIPSQLLSIPLKDWQANLTTVFVVVMILGRAFKAIKSGGGLRGLYRGLVYGENAPPPRRHSFRQRQPVRKQNRFQVI